MKLLHRENTSTKKSPESVDRAKRIEDAARNAGPALVRQEHKGRRDFNVWTADALTRDMVGSAKDLKDLNKALEKSGSEQNIARPGKPYEGTVAERHPLVMNGQKGITHLFVPRGSGSMFAVARERNVAQVLLLPFGSRLSDAGRSVNDRSLEVVPSFRIDTPVDPRGVRFGLGNALGLLTPDPNDTSVNHKREQDTRMADLAASVFFGPAGELAVYSGKQDINVFDANAATDPSLLGKKGYAILNDVLNKLQQESYLWDTAAPRPELG
ncbi:MAG: hypothetical protein JWO47_52 [Candidatus Saccharibacteria bacterium]|nr:hypothetical protein [Candidatus Saccharibacteria bacterium]